MISTNIRADGTLEIYIGNRIEAKISDCENMTEEEINILVDEILEEAGIEIA